MNDNYFDPYALGLKVTRFSGYEAMCICDFHNDHSPSASFNVVTGLFYCFSCGTSKNVFQLARALGGSVRRKFIPGLNSKETNSEWRSLLTFPIAAGHPYLERRRVSPGDITRFGIRANDRHIIIPTFSLSKAPVGVVMRNLTNEGPRYLSFGKKPPLWPLLYGEMGKPGTKLFVVEGIFGALRARASGVSAVATLGAMIKKEAAPYLKSYNVFGLFDNDFAGYVGGGRLLTIAPNSRIVVPGQEADELSEEEWHLLREGAFTTRKMEVLQRLSGQPEKFRQYLKGLRA